MRNPNVPVYFQGFRSSTWELGNSGWVIQADQDLHRDEIRMVFTNKESGAILLSRNNAFDFQGHALGHTHPAMINELRFDAQIYHADTRIMEQMNFSNLRTVEYEPSVEQLHVKTLSDMVLFKEKPKKEILVEPATIPEMMELIKKMQSPRQKELRDKQRDRAKREIYTMEQEVTAISHAEIITLV
jgi:hypothetical protein